MEWECRRGGVVRVRVRGERWVEIGVAAILLIVLVCGLGLLGWAEEALPARSAAGVTGGEESDARIWRRMEKNEKNAGLQC